MQTEKYVADGWKLKREKLELSPVYSTALTHDDHKVGYVRLSSFSQKAASDMRRHIKKLEVPTKFPIYPSLWFPKDMGKVVSSWLSTS